MNYKISIIIPIFNAELFLNDLINSLINQTIGFENIELILVDDCSTDNTRNIIKGYADKYENIKPIFLKENSGAASYPRNVGISKSTAQYLQFLDSDDDVDDNYCKYLYDLISTNDVDIVNCNYSSKLNNNLYISKDIENITNDSITIDNEEKMLLGYTAWGNIYTRSLIIDNNITFPDTMFDDGVFSLKCLSKTKKPIIVMKNYPGYVYLIENEDSITHKVSLNTLTGFIEGYKLCYDSLKEYPDDIIEKNLINFINMAIFILVKLDDSKKGIEILSEYENSLNYDVKLNSKILDIYNNTIKNKQFKKALIFTKILSLFYNNKRIRNFVFIKFNNLKLMK